MTEVGDVIRRLKDCPKGRKLVLLHEGQYYDVKVDEIRSVYVKPEKAMDGILDRNCYGIADDDDPKSFEVLAIE